MKHNQSVPEPITEIVVEPYRYFSINDLQQLVGKKGIDFSDKCFWIDYDYRFGPDSFPALMIKCSRHG